VSRAGLTALAVVSVLAAPVAGAAGCGGGKGGATAGGATEVTAADFRFEPARLEVKPGAMVRWTNRGQTAHNVKGPGFGTQQVLDPGQSYSHRFDKPGTYRYLCTLHPTQMKGTVVVR
jgi:plastocyanin